MEKITVKDLKEALEKSWCRETSYCYETWTSKNPAWGQCFVTMYVVWCYFGGRTKVAFIESLNCWHYWNVLPDGTEVDLTRSQFPKDSSIPAGRIIDIDWKDVFCDSWMEERCKLLKKRVDKYLKNKGGKR